MLASSIVWILRISGAVTALAGAGAFLGPAPLLKLVFGIDREDAATTFFVRHWGVLVAVTGMLIAWSAYLPDARLPILIAGAAEKAVLIALVFFGPLKRTPGMTLIAAMDGVFTILYVLYLTGV